MSARRSHDEPVDHGRVHTYRAHKCRCTLCTAANTAEQARATEARIERGLADDDPRHGKATTYANWRCRCDLCRKAWSEASKERRHRNKAEAREYEADRRLRAQYE